MKIKGVIETSKKQETTIMTESAVGQHLGKVFEKKAVSYLMFNKQKLNLVEKMTIGRNPDNTIVIDNQLVSRVHALIQKIENVYFLKDENSTNGTFLNGNRILPEKYYKLNSGDKITVGGETVVMS